jgi:ATP-binding cassette subfamily F protein 3
MAKMNTPAGDLSGGEKARLLLGLATFVGPHLMILDEPTNHLDIDSREALIQALAEYSGAVILISHDRHLIEASVDRLWLVADGTAKSYDGDIAEYRQSILFNRSPGDRSDANRNAGGRPPKGRRQTSAKRREGTAPLRKQLKSAESLIDDLQAEIRILDRKLADTSLYERHPDEAARLAKARSESARSLANAEERWLSLTAEHE